MATRDDSSPSSPPGTPPTTSITPPTRGPDTPSRGVSLTLQHPIVCRWRTARYHDQECSRYFDCPSHVVERALSDSEQEREEEPGGDHHQEEDIESGVSAERAGPGAVSPSSDEESGGVGQRARSPSPGLPTARYETAGASASTRSGEPSGQTPGRQGQAGESAEHLILSSDGSPVLPPRRVESERPAASAPHEPNSDREIPTLSPLSLARRRSVTAPRFQAANQPATPSTPAQTSAPGPSTVQPTVTEGRRPSELVLPRWQPDAEVTYCPICHTQFSIFVRKHHCRKCGRVVCNSCSPHRITIPYQYIVRPPGTPSAQRPVSLLDSQIWYSPEFSGGERVRLCNPCVPDPNTAPPQAQPGPDRAGGNLGPTIQSENAPISNRWSFYFGAASPNDGHGRSRSVTMQPGAPSSSRPSGQHYPLNAQSRILSGTPPAYYRPPPSTSSQIEHMYPSMAARYRSMLDVLDGSGGSSAGPSSAANRRLPTTPQPPQIAEEDECPVCHRELPPRTLANFEALRESHINTCIATHSRYGGGGPSGSSVSGSDGGGGSPLPVLPRRTGMFPYTATEKDCVDSAECTICLEEFEVGVAMARLECLCRFHRRCIAAWWERHPGRCPMHQHDGFGY
ncbi:FYVE-domain-containing protein [Canariomyces notabilis]|uniref:RING-type E3 ubiquitin transferase n=1 Tax=Canariomyces notabilis TaxID=2074819 RepID=A0AAN6TCN7_9PEZI|nr:FYVE-domain-containing protein [Canariomyces arenarius]